MASNLQYNTFYINAQKRSIYFVDESTNINSRFLCSICTDVLINPVQTECGCRFCNECINSNVNISNKMCPCCKNEIVNFNFVKDKAVEKEIFNLKIKCLYDGCDCVYSLKDLNSHLIVCGCRLEPCQFCDKSYRVSEKENHLQMACTNATVECTDCGLKMTRFELDNVHRNIDGDLSSFCVKWKGKCPFKCSSEIYENLLKHIAECIKKPVTCPLKGLGCGYSGSLEKIDVHLAVNIRQHMLMMVNELSRYNEENERNKQVMENQKLEIDRLRRVNNELSIEMKVMTARIEENRKTTADIQSEIYEHKRSIGGLAISNETSGVSVVNGVCLWVIRNIRTKISAAKSNQETQIISEAFYLHHPGYRICLKVYPNGDGRGQGEFLSVYFVVMQGEYDDEVSWPFKLKVTMNVVSNNAACSNVTVHMKPDNNESCYGRPVHNTNVGAGQPEFIRLSELLNNDNYLHNGSLVVTFTSMSINSSDSFTSFVFNNSKKIK